jgi:signal transduction histidine kinase
VNQAGIEPRVDAECIRTLFRQMRTSFAAAGVVACYMIATAIPYSAPRSIAIWAALQAVSQLARLAMFRAYVKAAPGDAALGTWGRRNTLYMLTAGLIWGSTTWWFVHLDQPITVALTLCGLYGIAGGSVPVNAYNPPGLYAFVGGIFGLALVRLLSFGDLGHIVLGVASLAFAGILASFCRVQHRSIRESFLIRFENEELLDALRVQTEQAEAARQRAEQASLAKSQFLAAASHDLRQPLHALGLFSGTLGTIALDGRTRELADHIQDNVAAMETLFNALLDVSRLDAGVVAVRRETVSLDALFAQIGAYLDGHEKAPDVRLVLRGQGLWVRSDPILLMQILCNLAANALTYTPRGRVMLAARWRGGAVLIECRDSGIGIAPADQARIFEEFVQIGNAERDRRKGLGLGLAIAQRTARLLGSEVGLRSIPGRGSCFFLSLPIAEPAEHGSAGSGLDASRDLVAGLRVLVIDDEPAVRDACRGLLASWGVEATVLADVGQAIAILAGGRRIDVLLCDQRLDGDVDGLAAITRLRAIQTPPPAACLVTGETTPDLLARAQALGVPLLHKPLLPGPLRATLNHLAATRQSA